MRLQWAELKVARVAVVAVKLALLATALSLGAALAVQLALQGPGPPTTEFSVALRDRVGKCLDTKEKKDAFDRVDAFFQSVSPQCPCCITRPYEEPRACRTERCRACREVYQKLSDGDCDAIDLEDISRRVSQA